MFLRTKTAIRLSTSLKTWTSMWRILKDSIEIWNDSFILIVSPLAFGLHLIMVSNQSNYLSNFKFIFKEYMYAYHCLFASYSYLTNLVWFCLNSTSDIVLLCGTTWWGHLVIRFDQGIIILRVARRCPNDSRGRIQSARNSQAIEILVIRDLVIDWLTDSLTDWLVS